jgi:tetratricopeptide (TPR) repeat protein
MSHQRSLSVLRLVAGLLITPIASGPASAQTRPAPRPGQPAAPDRAPGAAGQDLAPAEMRAWQGLARALSLAQSDGHDAEAISAVREALKDHVKPAPGTPDNFTLEALSLLVDLYSRTGQLAEEVGARREQLDALRRVLGGRDWRVRDAIVSLADAERRLAATPEQRRRFIEADESIGRSVALMNAGRLGEALQAAAKATEIYRELEGDDHRDVSNALTLRGLIHEQRREYAAARSMFEQAIVVRRKTLGEDHPDTALVMQHMASLAEDQGDFTLAVRLFQRIAELERPHAVEESGRRAELLETIGRLFAQQGDHGGARPYLESADRSRMAAALSR